MEGPVARGLDRWRLGRQRARLAQRVRAHARDERELRWASSIVDLESLHRRDALYEQVATRLEEAARPVPDDGLAALELYLAEPQPPRDFGLLAESRDARLAEILRRLDPAGDA